MEKNIPGESENLPKVDIYMVMDFFLNKVSCDYTEILGRADREGYGDEAIGEVQVRREGSICTVKCNVTPEHNEGDKIYHCIFICDESNGKIVSVICVNCVPSKDRCKHTIALVLWLHRRSEDPMKCYWYKSKSSQNKNNVKFIKAKDFGPNTSIPPFDKEIKSTDFLQTVINKCKEVNDYSSLLMNYHQPVDQHYKLSLHYLACKFKCENVDLDASKFVEFCQNHVTDSQCSFVTMFTLNQAHTAIWPELEYGRITDSLAYNVVNCRSPNDLLMEQVLGAVNVKEEFAEEEMERKKKLENEIKTALEEKLNVNISLSGILLSRKHIMIAASPFGLSSEHVYEIKCPLSDKEIKNYIKNDKLLPKYYMQLQLQMILAEKRKGYFCIVRESFEDSKNVDCYEIEIDEKYCYTNITKCKNYWFKYIFEYLVA